MLSITLSFDHLAMNLRKENLPFGWSCYRETRLSKKYHVVNPCESNVPVKKQTHWKLSAVLFLVASVPLQLLPSTSGVRDPISDAFWHASRKWTLLRTCGKKSAQLSVAQRIWIPVWGAKTWDQIWWYFQYFQFGSPIIVKDRHVHTKGRWYIPQYTIAAIDVAW